MYQIEIIGYIAGFLVATALAPQIIKTWKIKSAKDISTLWVVVLMSGLFLWIVYAIIQVIMPLAVFGIIEFSMALILLIFKFIYK
jgi:MtN3 and saliva related transmembrane protein